MRIKERVLLFAFICVFFTIEHFHPVRGTNGLVPKQVLKP